LLASGFFDGDSLSTVEETYPLRPALATEYPQPAVSQNLKPASPAFFHRLGALSGYLVFEETGAKKITLQQLHELNISFMNSTDSGPVGIHNIGFLSSPKQSARGHGRCFGGKARRCSGKAGSNSVPLTGPASTTPADQYVPPHYAY